MAKEQGYIDFDAYIRQGEPTQREAAYAWSTAIGLQAVDGLKTSEYLHETARKNIEGEIITRGPNVMLGYYKNPEATQQAIDSDGWYHTGDLATMSSDGHIFIRGRLKNMLLGANGQNVYPEEIEDKLNSMALVSESLIVQRGDHLIALIHPDMDEVNSMGFGQEELEQVMEQNRQELNAQLPVYSKLQAFELQEEEFQKTPKKSIKRYLYK